MDPTFLAGAIIILLFSIIIHEVMHGWVALKFGDHTAERAGRLTLNPIPHIDPVGSFLLPAALILLRTGFIIGWAKPVPVNPLNFTDIKKGELFVSLGGVAANFVLALLATILFHTLSPILGINNLFIDFARFTFTINFILGIFNLLPIPPLDGSKVLMSFLPLKYAREYEKLTPYGMFLLLLLWIVPIGGIPILSYIIVGSLFFFSSVLNVPLKLF